MIETKIPGIQAQHAVITPLCRLNRTAEGAFEEALRRLKESYDFMLNAEPNVLASYHLVITVERPPESKGNMIAHCCKVEETPDA